MNPKKLLFSLFSVFCLSSIVHSDFDERSYELAKNFYDKGLYSKSIYALENFIQNYPFSPYNALSHFLLAKNYEANKEYKKALEAYYIFYNISNNNSEKRLAFFGMAKSYYFLQNYKKAYSLFKSYYIKYPHSDLAVSALYYSALCAKYLGKDKESKALFQKLANEYPNSEFGKVARKKVSTKTKTVSSIQKTPLPKPKTYTPTTQKDKEEKKASDDEKILNYLPPFSGTTEKILSIEPATTTTNTVSPKIEEENEVTQAEVSPKKTLPEIKFIPEEKYYKKRVIYVPKENIEKSKDETKKEDLSNTATSIAPSAIVEEEIKKEKIYSDIPLPGLKESPKTPTPKVTDQIIEQKLENNKKTPLVLSTDEYLELYHLINSDPTNDQPEITPTPTAPEKIDPLNNINNDILDLMQNIDTSDPKNNTVEPTPISSSQIQSLRNENLNKVTQETGDLFGVLNTLMYESNNNAIPEAKDTSVAQYSDSLQSLVDKKVINDDAIKDMFESFEEKANALEEKELLLQEKERELKEIQNKQINLDDTDTIDKQNIPFTSNDIFSPENPAQKEKEFL